MDSPRKRRTENADSTPRTSKRRRLDETHTSTDLNDSYPTPSTPSTHKHHADFNGDEGPSNAGKPWKAKEKYISNHEDSLIFPEERLDAHHRSKHKSTVPIRRLTEFTFYSSSTRRRIRLDHVLEENETSTNPNLMSAYFNGMVSPMNGKQDGSSSISISKPSPIVSSEIRHVWQSDEYKDKKALDDMKIWVQTDFAWYILEHPSKDYIDWYIDCWLQHQIWLAISYTSKMAVASIQKFKAVLNRSVIACAERDFQRKVTMRKIETFIPSILQTITEAAQESYEGSIKLAETGFFRLLCAEYAPHLLDFIAEDDNSSDIQPPSPLLSRPPSSPHPQPKPPVEFESGFGEEPQPRSRSSSVSTQSSCDISRTSDSSTTNQEYPTFCTPLVRRLSQPYLPLLGLQEKGADDSWEDEHVTRGALSMDMSQREYVDIGLPKFTPPVSWDREGIAESTCLRWVDVDAQRFQPNDTVYVYFDNQRGQVLHIPPADLPKHIYIALILYLYLDKFERPKAHVIYFEPASNTSLGNLEEKENDLMVSLAHPQELILSNDCAEVHVTQFFGLCDNTYLVPGSPEPSPRKDSISYFYRYFWIAKDDDAFIDAKLFLNQSRDMVQTKSCPCCGNKDPRHCTKITPDGVVVGNTEYHINDFAYIQHEQSDKPYIIGQMLRFYTTPSKTIKIQYRRYYRPKLTPEQSHNDRLLTFDDSGTQYSIDANRLEGKCFVIPLAEDSQDNCLLPDDCFVCDFPPFVRLCRQCGFPDLPQKTQPLRGLDLFSGAGGLSIGLESTGVVETGWAVERDESAAKTFQKNHKDARVYNMCINRLLSEVYAREHQSEQLDDSDLIDFPRRGEVDIVFGGPPCQGFTVLNRQRRATDRRNQLILSFMSAVDILRPKYVLIENVKEMLSFPIGGISGGGMTFDGGIKRGFVKLVKRLLTGMDYQVRYGILHSGQYGVPQPRRRVFFLAAQRGLMLPDLPQPTHVAFLPLNLKVIVNEKHNEAEELSFTVSKRKNNNAPLGIVTVSDAISDLHRWEWRRPNLSELPEEEQIMHAERIVKKNIQVVDHTTQPFDVNLHVSGPEDPVPYRGGPMSNYQRMLRENRKFVTQHWSPTFHEEEIVRICSVPFKSQRDPKHVPGHNDLPPEQQRPSLHGKKRYDGRYGRLDNGDYFDVSIGRLGPNIDVGRVIHPDFHRILTIREAARSQGFPDRVEFECVGNSVSRITQQIGNSVPPPIAAAIGREIQKAWLEDMEEHNREGSVSL